MGFHAWVAKTPGGRLEQFEYEPEPLRGGDVEVAISHCGICHSDVHVVDGDWGDVTPAVPGHEIIGTVVDGDRERRGTRVGIGWQRGSCGTCEYCRGGDEELCPDSQATCMGHFGGFADRIRVPGRFAVSIPDALDSATAAPLLCGGLTVWSPLSRYVGPDSRVAVIGIGGLGHMALQFARAMECEVTAFSRRADKREDARTFGAHHFSTDEPPRGAYDLVLNTAHGLPRFESFLGALRPKGVFCQVGAAAEPATVRLDSLMLGRRVLTGSPIGSLAGMREMLEFAARHGIGARVEPVPMSDADAALDRTRHNRARYRMVLVA